MYRKGVPTATGVNVTGTGSTGGFVGSSNLGSSLFYDSVSGQVNGTVKTGGLVGQLLDGTAFYGSATNMTVNGTSETGGLVGTLVRGTVDAATCLVPSQAPHIRAALLDEWEGLRPGERLQTLSSRHNRIVCEQLRAGQGVADWLAVTVKGRLSVTG